MKLLGDLLAGFCETFPKRIVIDLIASSSCFLSIRAFHRRQTTGKASSRGLFGRPQTNCVKTSIKTWDKRDKSWRQHHDSERCAAVFIISFVSTVLLSLRHVADIVSWLLHVLRHTGVRPTLQFLYSGKQWVGFWTLSIALSSPLPNYNVSDIGSVSVVRYKGGNFVISVGIWKIYELKIWAYLPKQTHYSSLMGASLPPLISAMELMSLSASF
jgi:hypothetical protein